MINLKIDYSNDNIIKIDDSIYINDEFINNNVENRFKLNSMRFLINIGVNTSPSEYTFNNLKSILNLLILHNRQLIKYLKYNNRKK